MDNELYLEFKSNSYFLIVSSSTQVSTKENGNGEAIDELDEENFLILNQSFDSLTKRVVSV